MALTSEDRKKIKKALDTHARKYARKRESIDRELDIKSYAVDRKPNPTSKRVLDLSLVDWDKPCLVDFSDRNKYVLKVLKKHRGDRVKVLNDLVASGLFDTGIKYTNDAYQCKARIRTAVSQVTRQFISGSGQHYLLEGNNGN